MIHSEKDLLIVKTLIQLAKGLQMKVVAEGVETIAQLKILQESNVMKFKDIYLAVLFHLGSLKFFYKK